MNAPDVWFYLVRERENGSFTSRRILAYSRDIEQLKSEAGRTAASLDWQSYKTGVIYANAPNYVQYRIEPELKVKILL